MRQLALDIVTTPAQTFDNFVVGRNAEAIAHLRAAINGNGERFVYLWGDAGSGRTHLLRAACAAGNAPYVACGANSTFDDVAPLLAADDVERLGDAAHAALFRRYNALREAGGGLIASAGVPPVQLNMRADLLTRLGWGLVVQVHALDDGEKAQALAQQARARGFTLPDDVIAYLLSRASRDARALFAALEALDRHSLETKRAITVPLVRAWLAQQQ
jgi:DnaA family protein